MSDGPVMHSDVRRVMIFLVVAAVVFGVLGYVLSLLGCAMSDGPC